MPAKCKISKAIGGPSRASAPGPKKAAAPGDTFILIDNQNDTCTVIGVDAAGQQVDISAIATIAVTSDNPGVLAVDTPAGMTFKMTAQGPTGSTNITVVATFNDGSIGPFSFILPVDVRPGPVTGVVIVPGTPVPN